VSSLLFDFENLTVWRGERTALNRLSLQVTLGEHIAILGPNGSGKSTLIKAITRECYPRYAPPECTFRILGQDRWHVDELRSMLGIVTNDLVTTCTQPYSAKEIVLSGFFSAIGIWPWHEVVPEMEKKADELLEFMGLTNLKDRLMTEMSSGEVRRAVIARALVHQPKALILDEPTNSLDVHAFRDLRSTMSKLAQSGITIVLVTHNLPDIIHEIDRVICIQQGELVQDGTKKEVLQSSVLSKLFNTEVEVTERDGYYQMW